MTPRRYQIYDRKTRTRLELYATTLQRARELRRGLNKAANDPLQHIVIPGPDHRKYKP